MFRKRTLLGSIIVSMIIGGIAGFAIDRYGMQSGDSHFGKTRFMNYLTKQLDLTEMQQKQLDSIVTYVHPRFREIRQKFNADMRNQMDSTRNMIMGILTPEQQQKYQALFSQRHGNSDNR